MLALDDPRWAELTHAYGPASDTPDFLRQAAATPGQAGPNVDPFFTLWSSLCHQGDVYTASYAALPHLVQIALTSAQPVDFSFFMLPASIEIARSNGRGPETPVFLVEAYSTALARLVECGSVHRHEVWDKDMMLSVAAAEAVARGHLKVAEALLNLDDDWIEKINNMDWD